jgi:hypothetical protein
MYVFDMDKPETDCDDSDDDTWPAPLAIQGTDATGITVLDCVKRVEAYMKIYEKQLMDANWAWVTPKIEPQDIHLVQFYVRPGKKAGVYNVALYLGQGRNFHHLFAPREPRAPSVSNTISADVSAAQMSDIDTVDYPMNESYADILERLEAKNRA